MAEDWPKRFTFSTRYKALRRHAMVLIHILIGAELLLYLADRNPRDLFFLLVVTLASGWGYYISRSWERGPIVEAWPDRIRLPGRFWPRLTDVRYGQITGLRESSGLGLTVVYTENGRRRTSILPLRYLEGSEQLEELLRTKTGLETVVSRRWWASFLHLDPRDVPVVRASYLIASMFTGLLAVVLLLWASSSLERTPSLRDTVVLGIATYSATYALLVMRSRRKNRERGSRREQTEDPGPRR